MVRRKTRALTWSVRATESTSWMAWRRSPSSSGRFTSRRRSSSRSRCGSMSRRHRVSRCISARCARCLLSCCQGEKASIVKQPIPTAMKASGNPERCENRPLKASVTPTIMPVTPAAIHSFAPVSAALLARLGSSVCLVIFSLTGSMEATRSWRAGRHRPRLIMAQSVENTGDFESQRPLGGQRSHRSTPAASNSRQRLTRRKRRKARFLLAGAIRRLWFLAWPSVFDFDQVEIACVNNPTHRLADDADRFPAQYIVDH